MPALPYWLFPGDDRPTEEIDDEIAEELQLHLDLLAEEQERRALAPEEAKQKAAERFGDFNQLLRRCRREKQGDAVMLLRVQTGLLVVLIALVAAAGWRMTYIPDPILNAQYMSQTTELLQTIQNDLADMRNGVTPTEVGTPTFTQPIVGTERYVKIPLEAGEPPEEVHYDPTSNSVVSVAVAGSDLRGTVTDTDGKPIADADVLLILKTWPNNRYRQDDYAVKTDMEGKFILEKKIPLSGQYGVNAAVIAEGHALTSQYVLVKDAGGNAPDELKFELSPATSTRIIITDASGKPIAKALVAPSARVTEDDEEYLVYHQGSNPVWQKTDEDGSITLTWFAAGDIAKINIRPRGGEWSEKGFDVTDNGELSIKIAP